MLGSSSILSALDVKSAPAWLAFACAAATGLMVRVISSCCCGRCSIIRHRLVLGCGRRRTEARREAGSDSGQEDESDVEDGEEDEEPSSPRDAPDPRDCVIS